MSRSLALLLLALSTACVADPAGSPPVPADLADLAPSVAASEGDVQEPALHPDVVLVEDHPCVDSVDVSEDRRVLTFELACDPSIVGIEPGRIVVGTAAGGYLRRVESVALDGWTITAWTGPATLAEALPSGSMSLQIRPSGDRAMIELGGTTLYSGEVGPASVMATIPEGWADLDAKVDLDAHWADGEVQRFDAEWSVALSGEMELHLLSTNGLRFGETVDVYEASWPFATMIGPLPVAGELAVRVKAGFSADLPGEAQLELAAGGSAEAWSANRYTAEDGWSQDQGHELDWHADEPDFDLRSGGRIRGFLRAQPTVTLYGISGPELRVDLWTRAEAEADCAGLDWELDAGLTARARVRVDVFDSWTLSKTFASVDFTAALGTGTIPWPLDYPGPCGQTEIQCGALVTGDTGDPEHGALLDGYSCNVGSYEAPEAAYAWTATTDGPATWQLIDPTPTEVNHDVMVLDGSGALAGADCLDWGSNSVAFEAVAGQTYYLVVDGYDTDAGPFVAALQCDPGFFDGGGDDPFSPS
jgi:hypothetical protein